MPNQLFGPGLYIVRRHSPEKGVDHVAVLDVGNRSGVANWGSCAARLLEFTPDGLSFDPCDQAGGWRFEKQLTDERAAATRIQFVLRTLGKPYHLTSNNCEHMVSFVESGKPMSPQVRGALMAAVLMVTVVLIARASRRAA